MITETKNIFPELALMTGDCVPMSADGGKTWCLTYSEIKNHPEKTWKTWIELYQGKNINVANR